MMQGKDFIVLPALLAVALLAACSKDALSPQRSTLGRPDFKEKPPCPSLKMTGGGRIDAPTGGPNKNPPSSHDYQTFGAHVIQGLDQSGNCVIKGELEWVDHRLAFQMNGSPLNLHSIAVTSATLEPNFCTDGAVMWKGRLVVKNNGDQFDFTAYDCDNGEPGAKHDGFNIVLSNPSNPSSSLNGYTAPCPDGPNAFTCFLTGGNRQFHPTHS